MMETTRMRNLWILMTLLLLLLSPVAVWAAQWPEYHHSGGVTEELTPRTEEEAALKWKFRLKAADDFFTNISDPILVNDNVYIAVGKELLRLDTNGNELARGNLASEINYTCRPLYAEGKILIPLSGGRIQALSAKNLKSIWITDALPATADGEHQSMTSLVSYEGHAYMGTTIADWTSSYGGVFQCLEIATGKLVWRQTNTDAGYYWSGAAHKDDSVFYAGDDGMLTSHHKTRNEVIDILDLGAGVRSSVVVTGEYLLVSTVDGILHRVAIEDDGSFNHYQSISFAESSTTTPSVYNDIVFVGGSNGETGVLTAINFNTMLPVQSVVAPADVKSAPLLSIGYQGQIYAYFTANTEPGGIYALQFGDGSIEAIPLFQPQGEDRNYCMSSVVVDSQGTLIYSNDSGQLFAIYNKNSLFPIDIRQDTHGTTSSSRKVFVEKGESVTIPLTPEDGYEVVKVLLDGVEIPFSDDSCTISNVMKAHTLEVQFVSVSSPSHTIELRTGLHGITLPQGTTTVVDGQDLTIQFLPDAGYRIGSVLLDGIAVQPLNGSYILKGISQSHTMEVNFISNAILQTGERDASVGWIFLLLLSAIASLLIIQGRFVHITKHRK